MTKMRRIQIISALMMNHEDGRIWIDSKKDPEA
jgi:hypothetical protein